MFPTLKTFEDHFVGNLPQVNIHYDPYSPTEKAAAIALILFSVCLVFVASFAYNGRADLLAPGIAIFAGTVIYLAVQYLRLKKDLDDLFELVGECSGVWNKTENYFPLPANLTHSNLPPTFAPSFCSPTDRKHKFFRKKVFRHHAPF